MVNMCGIPLGAQCHGNTRTRLRLLARANVKTLSFLYLNFKSYKKASVYFTVHPTLPINKRHVGALWNKIYHFSSTVVTA